ncbi:MAG: YihY/virulence factor BrkB family protein [Chthoniobacterales bacterium]
MAKSKSLRTPRQLAKIIGEIVWYSGKDFFVDDGPHWAAAISFYGMLSIFPLMLAAVAIAAWFVEPQWATERASDLLGNFIPQGEETIRSIVEKAIAQRSRSDFISLAVLLWAGTRVFSALIRALNVAYDVDEGYGFWKRLVVELGMLLSAGVLFTAALLTDVLAAFLRNAVKSFPDEKNLAFSILGWLLPALLLLGGFFCLYRFVPRSRSNWKSALIGAGTASVLLSSARGIFGAYVRDLASYSQIYGWLAIGIVLLVWAYIAGLITVFCGELVSHIQLMIFEGMSGEEISQRHYARSPRQSRGGALEDLTR